MESANIETGKIGKRGVFTIPVIVRKRPGITDGSLEIAEERDDDILLRPDVARPVELYSIEFTSEFLLSTVVNAENYNEARREVAEMGLYPDQIPHRNLE